MSIAGVNTTCDRPIARPWANQLKQAEHAVQTATDDKQKRIQQANAEILKRRVAAFNDWSGP
jgi:hypothetical protein